MDNIIEEFIELLLKLLQIDFRRRTTYQIWHLAIDAPPVTGIIRVKIDANG
jgi:hypothetical protein